MSIDQKTRLSICFKTCGQSFEKASQNFETLGRAFVTPGWDFEILGQAFEGLKEN